MKYSYFPTGVCSRQINLELDGNGKITSCEFVGGCSGNTQGICMLVKGMDAKDAIDRLKGIDCRGRGTSCPDQLSKALEEALENI
ncbi:TIGR03905 family TSCPD domain-containing protein [Ruminococcus bromii]|uniref:TIGR03905 family TSCPD domain-containing protein n=1 Tax=Ruminococcus bromii TaxID=40518 RepID=UPI003FD859F5